MEKKFTKLLNVMKIKISANTVFFSKQDRDFVYFCTDQILWHLKQFKFYGNYCRYFYAYKNDSLFVVIFACLINWIFVKEAAQTQNITSFEKLWQITLKILTKHCFTLLVGKFYLLPTNGDSQYCTFSTRPKTFRK